MSNVLVVGDVHGCFENLNIILKAHKNLDAAIVCGDYGIWNDFSPQNIPETYNIDYPCPVYFVDGNHENHAALDTYERGKIHKIIGNLYFCAYGSVLNINNVKFLCCGGADSIDKLHRKRNISWWETECISESDQHFLPNEKIDIVISHTAPSEVCTQILELPTNEWKGDKCSDPSLKYLDEVLERYVPHTWFFGHWHTKFHTKLNNTMFYGLDMVPICNSSYITKNSIQKCSKLLQI